MKKWPVTMRSVRKSNGVRVSQLSEVTGVHQTVIAFIEDEFYDSGVQQVRELLDLYLVEGYLLDEEAVKQWTLPNSNPNSMGYISTRNKLKRSEMQKLTGVFHQQIKNVGRATKMYDVRQIAKLVDLYLEMERGSSELLGNKEGVH